MSVDAFIGIARGTAAWPGTRGRIETLAVPTLLICGELDLAFLKAIKRLSEKIPNSTLAIIPQAAHSRSSDGRLHPTPSPSTTRPREIWSRLLIWCARTTGCRSAGSRTAVPRRTRSVMAAT
jgi:hypothetical protein